MRYCCVGLIILSYPHRACVTLRFVSLPPVSQISRSTMFLVGLTDTQAYLDTLMGVRNVADQSELDPEPFGFFFVFIYVEQVRTIHSPRETCGGGLCMCNLVYSIFVK